METHLQLHLLPGDTEAFRDQTTTGHISQGCQCPVIWHCPGREIQAQCAAPTPGVCRNRGDVSSWPRDTHTLTGHQQEQIWTPGKVSTRVAGPSQYQRTASNGIKAGWGDRAAARYHTWLSGYSSQVITAISNTLTASPQRRGGRAAASMSSHHLHAK